MYLCVSCPYVTYFPTDMARYSLFMLKMPLNPMQTNKSYECRMISDLQLYHVLDLCITLQGVKLFHSYLAYVYVYYFCRN